VIAEKTAKKISLVYFFAASIIEPLH